MRMRGPANVAETLTPTLTLTLTCRIQRRSVHTQVNMKEMLQCFKDAHIPHIVNENTLDLIMSYCDKTGDGETPLQPTQLTLLCTTHCIRTRAPLAYFHAQARSTTTSWLASS